ncbi:hypothetical protein Mapa_014835 [Marchantia paleacea]|nr:hypothetical protein Mapa_014835 [Marchantia paleacea]
MIQNLFILLMRSWRLNFGPHRMLMPLTLPEEWFHNGFETCSHSARKSGGSQRFWR